MAKKLVIASNFSSGKTSGDNTTASEKHAIATTQSRIIGAIRGAHSQLWGQLSLYVPYMLRVNMPGDLAHLQLSDLQGETRPICRTSDLQGERMLICRT